MSTKSHTMQGIGHDGTIEKGVDHRGHARDTAKEKGIMKKFRRLIGKVVTEDKDWMFKSKDWPYMWNKK